MEKKRTKVSPPKYKDGCLICPYCNMPLVPIEETHFKIRCYICGNVVDKIPTNIMKKMLEDLSEETLNEWAVEMRTGRY